MFHGNSFSAALLLSAVLGAAAVPSESVRGAPPRTPPLASAARGDQRRLIRNGNEAPLGRHEYAVVMVNSNGGRCGGSLIADNAVLTSAWCAGRGNFVVRVGAHDVAGTAGVTADVEKVVIHPEYIGVYANNLENDIAVVILDRRIEGIRPVCMADPMREITSDEELHVLGWGETVSGGEYSSILREAGVEYITNEECSDKLDWVDADTFMCTTSTEGKGDCGGDHGGPLIVKGGDADEDMLVGVVSITECGSSPDVYSRLSALRGWIDKVVAEHEGVTCAEYSVRTTSAPTTTMVPLS